MTILANNIKRILKNKVQFLLILVLPALFLIPLSLNINADKRPVKIGILDLDKTAYTTMLADNLAARASVVELKDYGQSKIQADVINSVYDYILVLDKGYTSSLIQGSAPEPKAYYLQDSLTTLPVQKYLEGYLSSSQRIASAAAGDEGKFYQAMRQYISPAIGLDYQVIAEIDRHKSYTTLGMFLMFMLFTTVVYTTLILTDKENKTFYRTIAAPVSLKSYMFQNILGFLLISVLQVTVIFIVLRLFMGIYLGDSVLNMYLLFLVVSLVCVSFGVAISSTAKSVIQAAFVGLFLTFPMSFLGGCWWENDMSTKAIQSIGKFTPVYWIMEGVNKLLDHQSFADISGDVFIVLIFVLVFFFFGTWRREDIAA